MDRQSKPMPVAGLSELHRRQSGQNQSSHFPRGSLCKAAYTPPQAVLKRDALKQLLVILGLGATTGAVGRGLVGVNNYLRNSRTPGAADFGAKVPEPIRIHPPSVEDEEREKIAESETVPQDSFQGFANLLPYNSTSKPLGDWWGPSAGIALGAGGAIGGWKLTDWLLKKEREVAQKRELEKAKDEYEDAIEDGYRTAMKVAADNDIDGLMELVEMRKEANEGGALDVVQAPYRWLLGNDNWQGLKGGVLAASLLTAVPAGMATYTWAKKRNKQKLLQKALRIRARQRAATAPPPQYVTVDEEDRQYAA